MTDKKAMVLDEPSREITAASTEGQAQTLQVLMQTALDKGADADTMERLLAMSERIQDRQAKQEFWAAFHEARAEMPPIKSRGWNDSTKSAFPFLEDIKAKIEPICHKWGFSMMMSSDVSPLEGHTRLVMTLAHIGGHTETRHADIPLDSTGMKGTQNKTNVHATGSAFTYGERYLIKLVWNLTIMKNPADDDGNAAGEIPESVITEDQALTLETMGNDAGVNWDKFLEYFKVTKVENLSVRQYPMAVKMIEAKGAK